MKKALVISNVTKRFQPGHFSMITPLKDLGFEVHWAANFSEYKDDITLAPCEIHHIDFKRNPFNLINIKAYKQLNSLLNKNEFELIHCQSPIGGALGRICANKNSVKPIIYTAHGFHFYKGAPLINKVLYKSVEIILAKCTDGIITMNQEDLIAAKKINLRNKGKSYKIHGIGVDTRGYYLPSFNEKSVRKKIGVKEDSILLVSLGDLIKRKNYRTAIKAIKNCENPKIEYIICGTGQEENELRALVKELNLEDQIHFLGFRTDTVELLNCADIFIFTTYQEGLPRSMMEAMAAGLPCLASNIRGNIDLLDSNGGFLYSPDNDIGFSEGLNTLINNPELSGKMGKHNKEVVEKFDITNVKIEMKLIYKEILGLE
ncbi:hypothetical protein CKN99_12775 [Carnobacterium maltaromaticum]|uniref:glycosyltransferase family 4 protein n=1 Tax=Carnobacterium maltaromaticum TaxID=2751 RepID=UPI001071D791|nr:glycosyltransferase family 4 protein [Carnobacterium maltaromaticum]TFJ24169.1 hypothetical protein CKN90_12735 [Carnobacterium maltaromaticum]TFJ29574.1 hypothetical protein CKN98_12740 [Carnobacterium maltaromaticum]TFJ32712.1 hypothetical protein CKN88_12695 [Carnobacterium maltaromaticum]TFJ34828.1 hypothetical protein CKN99_12775 [Carnobacterium maltaromaticum]TFJ42017.1 hypothetical protein CKN92_12210 [Carnobacterium maltaromaticum]